MNLIELIPDIIHRFQVYWGTLSADVEKAFLRINIDILDFAVLIGMKKLFIGGAR